MKKNQLPQLLINIQNCKLNGRKLSRYLCANANLIADKLRQHQEEWNKAVTDAGFDPRLIRAIQDRISNDQKNDDPGFNVMVELKKESPDQYELFEKFENFRVSYFDKESDIKLIPIPERFLPNSTTVEDRLPIEMLIKIPKI